MSRDHVIARTAAIMDLILGPTITGVEVGVFGCQLSSMLLERYPSLTLLFGVDPYVPYGRNKWPQERWDKLHDNVQKKMAQFGDRWELLRMPSLKAVENLPDTLDFVYLDGDHDVENVIREIEMYEPLIVPGGIMCGHDYISQKDPGVALAVHHYLHRNTRVLCTDEKVNMWWWQVG